MATPTPRQASDSDPPGGPGVTDSTDGPTSEVPRHRPSRRVVGLVAVPLIVAWVMSQFGQAIFPELVDEHPAWLLALNPQNRYLALTANQLDALTYYPLGFTRLLLTDPLWFLIGYWYGDAAVAWTERHTRTWGELLRQIQRWFGKAAYPVIFIAPNSYICLFAGAAGMPFRRFLLVNATGTLARLYFFRVFGDVFDDPIDTAVGWIGDHRAILLPITIALTLVSVLLEVRRGETEVGSLSHLDDQLEDAGRELGATNAQEPGIADSGTADPRS